MNDQSNKPTDQLRPSTYDGIQEYDNDLPRWWVWLFYATGVYGVVCLIGAFGYGVAIPPVPHEPAGIIVAAGPVSGDGVQATDDAGVLRAKLSDAAALAKGKEVFVSRCAPCHGPAAGGLIGPNLTDNAWIHGGTLREIQTVIENGVLDKGMLAWKSMLSKEDILNTVVYIRSLRGSNPASGKGPEGTPYTGDS